MRRFSLPLLPTSSVGVFRFRGKGWSLLSFVRFIDQRLTYTLRHVMSPFHTRQRVTLSMVVFIITKKKIQFVLFSPAPRRCLYARYKLCSNPPPRPFYHHHRSVNHSRERCPSECSCATLPRFCPSLPKCLFTLLSPLMAVSQGSPAPNRTQKLTKRPARQIGESFYLPSSFFLPSFRELRTETEHSE